MNSSNNLSLADDQHAALIISITTLYVLLTDLQYLTPQDIRLPKHAATDFDTTAAAEAGFTDPEALALLRRLPFVIDNGADFLITYETVPLCYINTEEDSGASEEAFDFARDPTYQDQTDLMPDGVINLTRAKNGGTSLIYNVKRKTITAWNHFNDEVERWQENTAYGMDEEENPLYVWIRNWMSLVWVPHFVNDSPTFESMEGPPQCEEPDEETRASYQMYIDSGWDISAAQEGGSGSIPERLERARLRAKREFRSDELQLRREKRQDMLRQNEEKWDEDWHAQ